MKSIIVFLFSVLCTQLAYSVDIRQAEEAKRQQQQWERSQPGSTIIHQNNSHVVRDSYVPRDLVEAGERVGKSCDTNGNLGAHDSQNPGYCREFKSRADGSLWRIRFAQQYGSSAEHVFKMSRGVPTLWAQYNPGNQQTVYASPAARQYAAAHGGGGAAIAAQSIPQLPQAANGGGQCDQLSGKARAGCEAATRLGPAIGGLLKW